MLGEILGALIEFAADILFTLMPSRIAWHCLSALALGGAGALAASLAPGWLDPLAATVLGTAIVYPAVAAIYWLARSDARKRG